MPALCSYAFSIYYAQHNLEDPSWESIYEWAESSLTLKGFKNYDMEVVLFQRSKNVLVLWPMGEWTWKCVLIERVFYGVRPTTELAGPVSIMLFYSNTAVCQNDNVHQMTRWMFDCLLARYLLMYYCKIQVWPASCRLQGIQYYTMFP